jgi:5-methyltetrahydropteroyltriglutamate--homocysteine methyltransferase
MAQQCQDDYYGSKEKTAMAMALCVREEVLELFAAGADIVQLDEPYVQAFPEEAKAYAVAAIDSALEGVRDHSKGQETALHVCFGYAHVHKTANANHVKSHQGYSFLPELDKCKNVDEISVECAQPPNLDLAVLSQLPSKRIAVGCVDMSRNTLETTETAEEVAANIRACLKHLDAERFVVSADCGMKYLSREVAMAKMRAQVAGAAIVREELTSNKRQRTNE